MAEEKTTIKRRRKRKTTKKRSIVDSAARNAAALSDGCNPEFVIGAEFDGVFEMPIIKKPKKIIIPDNLVPFSKMEKDICRIHQKIGSYCRTLQMIVQNTREKINMVTTGTFA